MAGRNGSFEAALGLRRLALHGRHVVAGARFAPFAGWEMPLQYQGIVTEHEAVRAGVGVFDVSHLGRAWVVGSEAGARIRAVTTFDVTSLEAGRAHYSLYCNQVGGIDDDIFVYHVAPDRWLIAHNAANAEADYARLEVSAGDLATEATGDTVMLAVQGPQAPSVLTGLFGAVYEAMRPHDCLEVEWRGTTVLLARTGYTGEAGGECVIDADYAEVLWDALLEAGAVPAGLGARDTLRLEAALPLHGNDIDASTPPFGAGLGFAVSLDDDADFTGRAALAWLSDEPLARKLVCIRAVERGAVFRHGAPVLDAEGTRLGELTSGAYGPSLHLSIGMAYLPVSAVAPGTSVSVEVRGRLVPAEVVRRPFYRARVRKGV